MQKRIYFDFAASTPVDPEVLDAMLPYFSERYGNPSSVHSFGQDAQIAVDQARAKIAGVLGSLSQEVIFTASATEANNLAILGVLRQAVRKGNPVHVITSAIEHESILEPLAYAEKELGVTVSRLPVSKGGMVQLSDVEKALRPETALVSVMLANNEIGMIQPIAEITALVKKLAPSAVMHTDAVQAANYLSVLVRDLGIDMMTLSSHKIYGPKGAGILYAKKGTMFEPLVFGGGQEYGKRSGTENVPAIVGCAEALSRAQVAREEESRKVKALSDYFITEVLARIPGTILNGAKEPRLPNNANIFFPYMSAAELIVAFDMEGVAVSAGSACQSKALAESHVLTAIGLSKADAKSSLRFSFGKHLLKSDIDRVLDVLVKLTSKLKK